MEDYLSFFYIPKRWWSIYEWRLAFQRRQTLQESLRRLAYHPDFLDIGDIITINRWKRKLAGGGYDHSWVGDPLRVKAIMHPHIVVEEIYSNLCGPFNLDLREVDIVVCSEEYVTAQDAK